MPQRRKSIRQISPETAKAIVEDYQAGKTVYELAAQYGCHRNRISSILKQRGVTLRSTPPTEEQVQQMIHLYNSGLPLADVGDRFGFHPSTVWRNFTSRGVATRDPHERVPSTTRRKRN